MPSSLRRAARSGWWPSTASSTSSGYERAGALSRRAARASARSHELLGSRVEYRRLEASRLDELGETFDFVFCLGILHRVTDPLGLLRLLRARLADGGRVLLETYGINGDDGSSPCIRVHRPGDVYADDEFVYWGFGAEALRRLAELAGFTGFQLHATPIIDGHPRIIASLTLTTDE